MATAAAAIVHSANPKSADESLWWDSFVHLFSDLENASFSKTIPQSLVKKLKNNHNWFLGTISLFKPPNEKSRASLDSSEIVVGSHRLIVKSEFKELALQVSYLLRLDEVQSYILVHRYADRDSVKPDIKDKEFLHMVLLHYCIERQCLLKCTRQIFMHALHTEDGSKENDVIREEALELISNGLDRNFLSILQDLLSSKHLERMEVDLATLWAEEILMEVNLVLDTLFLVYYESLCACTCEHWKRLCLLYKGILSGSFNSNMLVISNEARNYFDHCKVQLLLILIETLDLENLLQMVHDEVPFRQVSSLYSSTDIQEMDAMVSSFNSFEAEEASPLVLSWAVFICLISSLPEKQDSNLFMEIDHVSYVQQALKSAPLSYLLKILKCNILENLDVSEMGPSAGYCSVLRTLVSAFIASYEMTLQLEDGTLNLILDILCGIYRGEESLCVQFWDRSSFVDGPIRCLLCTLEGEFPYRSVEFIRFLSALCEGTWPAECVYNFLDKAVGMSSLFEVPDATCVGGTSQIVETCRPLHVPGLESLLIPSHTRGQILKFVNGNTALVRWEDKLQTAVAFGYTQSGVFVLLLLLVRQFYSNCYEETQCFVDLLCRLVSFNTAVCFGLMNVDSSYPVKPAIVSGTMRVDLVEIICSLIRSSSPNACNAVIMSMSFNIVTKMLKCSPSHVISVIRMTNAFDVAPNSNNVDVNYFGSPRRFKSTMPIALDLTMQLVEEAADDDITATLVVFFLQYVLVNHEHWKYKHGRWKVTLKDALSSLTVFQQAMLSATMEPVPVVTALMSLVTYFHDPEIQLNAAKVLSKLCLTAENSEAYLFGNMCLFSDNVQIEVLRYTIYEILCEETPKNEDLFIAILKLLAAAAQSQPAFLVSLIAAEGNVEPTLTSDSDRKQLEASLESVKSTKVSIIDGILKHVERFEILVDSNPYLLLNLLNFLKVLWQGAAHYMRVLVLLKVSNVFWTHLSSTVSVYRVKQAPSLDNLSVDEILHLGYKFQCHSVVLDILVYDMYLEKKLVHMESPAGQIAGPSKERKHNAVYPEKFKTSNQNSPNNILLAWFKNSTMANMIISYASCEYDDGVVCRAKVAAIVFIVLVMKKLATGDAGSLSLPFTKKISSMYKMLRDQPAFSELLSQYSLRGYRQYVQAERVPSTPDTPTDDMLSTPTDGSARAMAEARQPREFQGHHPENMRCDVGGQQLQRDWSPARRAVVAADDAKARTAAAAADQEVVRLWGKTTSCGERRGATTRCARTQLGFKRLFDVAAYVNLRSPGSPMLLAARAFASSATATARQAGLHSLWSCCPPPSRPADRPRRCLVSLEKDLNDLILSDLFYHLQGELEGRKINPGPFKELFECLLESKFMQMEHKYHDFPAHAKNVFIFDVLSLRKNLGLMFWDHSEWKASKSTAERMLVYMEEANSMVFLENSKLSALKALTSVLNIYGDDFSEEKTNEIAESISEPILSSWIDQSCKCVQAAVESLVQAVDLSEDIVKFLGSQAELLLYLVGYSYRNVSKKSSGRLSLSASALVLKTSVSGVKVLNSVRYSVVGLKITMKVFLTLLLTVIEFCLSGSDIEEKADKESVEAIAEIPRLSLGLLPILCNSIETAEYCTLSLSIMDLILKHFSVSNTWLPIIQRHLQLQLLTQKLQEENNFTSVPIILKFLLTLARVRGGAEMLETAKFFQYLKALFDIVFDDKMHQFDIEEESCISSFTEDGKPQSIWGLGLAVVTAVISSLGESTLAFDIVDNVILYFFSEKTHLMFYYLSAPDFPSDGLGKKRARVEKTHTNLTALREIEHTFMLIHVLAKHQNSWAKAMKEMDSQLRERSIHLLAFISRGSRRTVDSPSRVAPLLFVPLLKEEVEFSKRPSFINSKHGWFAVSSRVSRSNASTISSKALVIKDQRSEHTDLVPKTYFSDVAAIHIYRIAFLILKFLCLQVKEASKRAEEVGFIDLAHFPELPMPEILHGLQDQAIAILTELCETNKSEQMLPEVHNVCFLLLQIMEKALFLELSVSQICGIRPVLGRVEDFSKGIKTLLQVAEKHTFLKASLKSLKQIISFVYPGLLQTDDYL
ncbi:hypothetical protein Syun_005370 [Stephania yunnanensis]|uniref:Uncharacterized protein n=1 Tax=Stephania yunnanensis TaxID=152371 RepID=A0AAP0Q266_9MAGN